jgi:hypothetical protein
MGRKAFPSSVPPPCARPRSLWLNVDKLTFPPSLFPLAPKESLLNLASEAKVPVAIHLDHATTDEDIDLALTFAEQGQF